MNTQDICKFIPSKSIDKDLLTLNFVYECQFFPEEFLSKNAYSINLVSAGRGILHIRSGEYQLQPGVMFFTFPQQEYRVESTEDLHFMYVSFLGIRANALMERLGLCSKYAVFTDCGALLPIWKQAIHASQPENLDLITTQAVVAQSLSCVQLFATPWTVAHQAPQSMEFSRQEYWSGVPLPSLSAYPKEPEKENLTQS